MKTLLITIVPSIAILLYFFLSDKFKEPKGTIALVFILGVLICFPAGILNDFMISNFGDPKDINDLTYSFFGPAWTEEILKFLVLYLIVLRRNEFNEPMDGIVYGVVVSLGFATYENYDYVFRLAETWEIAPEQMAIWRSYSAVPMHGLNGCLMGFYFGMYAFSAENKFLYRSLYVPYILHGIYNYLTVYSPLNILIIFIMIGFALYLHKELKTLQKKKKNEKELKRI